MLTGMPLSIPGAEAPVPHVFYRQQAETATLGVLLPGLNYSTRLPLLHYPRGLLLNEVKADVLQVDYEYHRIPGFLDLPAPVRNARMEGDILAVLEAALQQRPYRRLILVGKSLGTLGISLVLPHLASRFPGAIRCAWLTPLLTDAALVDAVRQVQPASLFAAGTADPYYRADVLEELCTVTGGRAVLVPGADHGLEIPGDVERSLDVLRQVILAVKVFVAGE